MGTKLFVGNLDYSTMDHQLREAFAEFGEILSASVVLDRMTGQSRGFGFVEYGSTAEAEKALSQMNGAMLQGRAINVNVARDRRADGGGGGGGGGGGRRPSYDNGGSGGGGGGRRGGKPREGRRGRREEY
jgi:heterogeneous nuclear ribonucleoprotein A1/A3